MKQYCIVCSLFVFAILVSCKQSVTNEKQAAGILPFYTSADFTPQWITPGSGEYASIHTIPAFQFFDQAGDTVTWLAVSGSHNVCFWPDSVPKGAVELLRKAMPDTIAPLLGARKPVKGDTYVVVFTGMPRGVYKYYCKPHLNKLMVGELTIK